jgi:post-segregation antitoxin (ccd killing protein)
MAEKLPVLGPAATPRTEEDLRWMHENLDAMSAWNDYIAVNGIPYAEFRRV